MTNYEIKNYNHYAETMCELIAKELELDEMTKAVLRACVYSKHCRLIWEAVREKYDRSEVEWTLMDLEDMGLLIHEENWCYKLNIPTYDELMEMRKLMEERATDCVAQIRKELEECDRRLECVL